MRGGGAFAGLLVSQIQIKKKTDFVGTKILNALGDLTL